MGLFDFVGDILGTNKSDEAIGAQTNAANQANDTQLQIYNQTKADQEPWRQAGMNALGQLQNGDFQRDFTMDDFQKDPGYDFRMAEGQKALDRSASAKGLMGSGGTMKALTRYAQGVASDEFNNAYNRFNADRDRRFNRLSSLAGVGQTANSQVASAGQNYGNNVSQNQIGLGNAIASANIAQGNQNAQMLNNGLSAAFMFSDERLKKDIEPISREDLAEMRSHLKAYRFRYKDELHGSGDYIGVMAQDLEKSKLGKTMVFEDQDGNKQIDLGRVLMLFLATQAEA